MLSPVLAMMVLTESILSSYSLNPVLIGSIANDEIIRLPALTAELVIFARAVTPITSNAENLEETVPTDAERVDISTFLADLLMFSNPLAESSNFSFCFSLSIVDILVETFFSKWALSNCIDTIFSSTCLLIA